MGYLKVILLDVKIINGHHFCNHFQSYESVQAYLARDDDNLEFNVQYGVVQYGDPDVEVINAAGRTAMRTRAVVARHAMMSAMPN